MCVCVFDAGVFEAKLGNLLALLLDDIGEVQNGVRFLILPAHGAKWCAIPHPPRSARAPSSCGNVVETHLRVFPPHESPHERLLRSADRTHFWFRPNVFSNADI